MNTTGFHPFMFSIYDRSREPMNGEVLRPFAIDELICRSIGVRKTAVVHIWRHDRAFVLGLRDRRLAFAKEAMGELQSQGYSVAVRNSGGAAVPLDPGVVNLSLIVPKLPGTLDYKDDFNFMAGLISATVADLSDARAASGEVAGAYCPGEFDLSIGGRKFCGIAQRRQLGGMIIQAFVNVEGSGMERAERVARFYQTASGGETDAAGSLFIQPSKLTSLQEQIPSLTVTAFVNAFQQRIRLALKALDDIPAEDEIEKMIEVLRERYDG